LASETPVRRSIIRHLFIIVDLSESMMDKDFRPTRFEVTLTYLRGYVTEWFDQNPLGQMGIILLRDRLAETLVPMGGEHVVMRAAGALTRRQSAGDPVVARREAEARAVRGTESAERPDDGERRNEVGARRTEHIAKLKPATSLRRRRSKCSCFSQPSPQPTLTAQRPYKRP